MPRLPKLFDKGSLKRTGIAVGALMVVLGGIYWYQPQRFDLVERKPKKPLPIVPIEETGLFVKGKKVVLITAHPDDEAFYLGGTLFKLKASGARVSLIVMTDGDKSYYPFSDPEPLRKVRRRELRESAKTVGIEEVVFLGYPDGRLSFEEGPVAHAAEQLERLKPDIVLTFDPYFWPRVSHRDHRVAGEIAEAALKKIEFSGWAMYCSTNAPNTFSDVDRTWDSAQDLLAVHASQFYGERLDGIRAMVSEKAEKAGQTFGVTYAEPFRAMHYRSGKPD